MSRRGKRYDEGPKLNMKKVIAVILAFVLIIAVIFGIKKMLDGNAESISGKIENVCYYTIYDEGKWGIINSYGDIVIKPTYDEMIVIPNPAQDMFICTYDVDYSSGSYKTKVINAKSKEIIKDYDKIEVIANYDKDQKVWYEENVFRVQKDGKYGLVNYSGKKLLDCEYNSITPISGIENSLVIEKDSKFGLCDDAGNIIIEPNYKKIEKIGNDYKNGYIVINEENKYGIIGFDKSKILDTKYEEIKGISGENIYAVKENGKYVLINKSEEKITNKEYDDIAEINKEQIVVAKNGKYGVETLSGDRKVKFEYDELVSTNDKYYIAKKGDKYGIVTSEGEEKLPCERTKITYVSSGNFVIADDTIYDENYEEKIKGTVTELNDTKGYIRVFANEEYKYYNFKFEEKPASQILTSNKLFLSKKDGKYGYVDKDGNVVIDYIYDDGTEQNSSGYAGVKKDGVWGAINLLGQVVIEPTYNLDSNKKIDFIGTWHLCEDPNANYYLDV
ncbi:MAG: WG repeat-containing protein [Clostridia bacterium]|nr:WG repeat-containing protein [Clostridia bacterium]